MDKALSNDSTASISSSSSSTAATNREMFLKNVNRNSHKISKPIRKPLLPPAAAASAIPVPEPNPLNSAQNQPQSQQPPVYNINKNDFRDVVQKLTGSPAHERNPTPPPPAVTHPRPPSSRLQRIRPPPLSQIGNRPNHLTQLIPRPQNDGGQRFAAPPPQVQPFQPLPPLPSVHPSAESPISAYMRFLQSSASSPAPLPLWNGGAPVAPPRPDSLVPHNDFAQRPPFPHPESPISAYMRFFQSSAISNSPRGHGVPPLPPPQPPHTQPPSALSQQQQQQHPPPPHNLQPSPFPVLPLSPLPFGCVPSPKSPYGLLSPSFLFSPTGQLGLPQLPLSPTLPVPSPRWKGI